MLFKTKEECVELAGRAGYVCRPERNEIDGIPPFAKHIRFGFFDPKQSTRDLASKLVGRLTGFKTMVTLVTEWGIWPSSENMPRYYKLRRAFGDESLLSERPGHVSLANETEDLTNFLDIAMQFGWGCVAFPVPRVPRIGCLTISHDQWIEIKSNRNTSDVVRWVDEFGMKVLSRS